MIMSLYERFKNLGSSKFLIIGGALILGLAFYFSEGLGFGFLFLFFLLYLTIAVLKKFGGEHKKALTVLFLIVILTHLAAALFFHYAQFYPFGGGEGDQRLYHQAALNISEDFRSGNFSLKDIQSNIEEQFLTQSYPVLIAALYTVGVPDPIIPKIFNVWLSAISILLVYLIALQIGASKKGALFAGLLANVYPSYLYFGSLLLREALVATLVLTSLLLIISAVKKFSWKGFALFYFTSFVLIHFRFYIGFAILYFFVFAFLLLSTLDWQKKLRYGPIVIILLGFVPQLLGHGYYAFETMSHYLQPEQITLYREHAYTSLNLTLSPDAVVASGSTVIVKAGFENPFTFISNYIKSFTFVFLGPLPWHIKYSRHLFAIVETMSWYLLLFFIAKGIIRSSKKYRIILTTVLLSIAMLGVIGLFIDNFGIYMRIRMPAFLVLLSLVSLQPFLPKIFNSLEEKMDKLWRFIKRAFF